MFKTFIILKKKYFKLSDNCPGELYFFSFYLSFLWPQTSFKNLSKSSPVSPLSVSVSLNVCLLSDCLPLFHRFNSLHPPTHANMHVWDGGLTGKVRRCDGWYHGSYEWQKALLWTAHVTHACFLICSGALRKAHNSPRDFMKIRSFYFIAFSICGLFYGLSHQTLLYSVRRKSQSRVKRKNLAKEWKNKQCIYNLFN